MTVMLVMLMVMMLVIAIDITINADDVGEDGDAYGDDGDVGSGLIFYPGNQKAPSRSRHDFCRLKFTL